MKILYVGYLISYAFLLAFAQIVLKYAVIIANNRANGGTVLDFILALVMQFRFWIVIVMCAVLVFSWAWLLTLMPLFKAYPFVVLAFIFAALLEHYIFGQAISSRFFFGCALIAIGLVFMI